MPFALLRVAFARLLRLVAYATGAGLCLAHAQAAELPRIAVLTEEVPPHVVLRGNTITGPTTEWVRAIVKRAGYQPDIQVRAWQAVVQLGERPDPVLIYPIVRTPERESGYQWIARLTTGRSYFYRLATREDIVLTKLTDARRYQIGAVRKDVRTDYLISRGFTPGPDGALVATTDNLESLRLLKHGRIDLVPITPAALEATCARLGINPDEFTRMIPTGQSMDFYLAANKAVPPETIERLVNSYRQLVAEGLYAQMMGDLAN